MSEKSLASLKVLDIELVFPPEPNGRLAYEFVCGLAAKGYEVTVITPKARQSVSTVSYESYMHGHFAREKGGSIVVIRVPPRRAAPSSALRLLSDHILIPLFLAVWSLWVSRDVDVIHCPSPPLALAFLECLVSFVRRVPLVVRIHDLHPDALVKMGLLRNRFIIGLLEVFQAVVFRRARALSVVAASYKSYIISKGIEPAKVSVIPNWIPFTSPLPSSSSNSRSIGSMPVYGRFIVAYGGAMYWAQDLETVIDAAYLLRHDKDICFLIMGDGPTKESIVRRSRLLGLQNVLIMPLQPRDIYLNIIATASVCLVPLRKGYSSPTLPSKIPELMSMGKPIIASAVSESEVGRLFAEAQCGLLVAPGDPKSLAASILTLKEKPELAKALGENGKRYAESHFSANSSIELYASLLMNASKKMQQLH